MDQRASDFDELEPRTTPQPTVLKCMADPSVPEVSLIFAEHSHTTQLSTKNRDTPEKKRKVYANWKKDGFFSVIDSRGTRETDYSAKMLSNTVPIQFKQNRKIAVSKHCFVAATRNNDVDSTHLPNYEQPFQDEISNSAFLGNKPVDAPVQNDSYDAIKYIPNRYSLNNTSVTNPKSDNTVSPDGYFQTKSPLQFHQQHHQTPRDIDDALYSPKSPVPRCQHPDKTNGDHDTVRDLLLLVQNQNEQIKSLQTQVERLLQSHEHNIGYLENQSSVITKSSGKTQSPAYKHKTDTRSQNNVVVSAHKTCHSRGINTMSSQPSDERSEVCFRYQIDPLKNTMLEKKVSIGVMTSFEFSVQNNPFVSDSDNQINAVLRDCGKNVSESGEAWRSNMHCSRKVATGPLENIIEDAESHPSSIWKQSSNNTQGSSSAKFTSRLIANVNDDRVDVEDVPGCSSISEVSQSKPNTEDSSVIFLNKPTHLSVGLRNFRSHKDCVPSLLDQQVQNVDSIEVSSLNNGLEHEKNHLYRQNDLNDYTQAIEREFSHDSYLKKKEHTSRGYSGQSENETRSMLADNTAEGSFLLCGSDLEVPDRSLPSLDPSIHVEMREYSSDDENEKFKRVPAVGWTFYKNVVGQVNRILHTMPGSQEVDANEKINPLTFHNDIVVNEDILKSVKSATLERLKMLGISYAEHSEFNGEHTHKKVTFDSSYCPPVDYQANTTQPTTSINETNTSMHMKALALKYLSDEQLADLAVHKQGHETTMKHTFLSIHGTNMSMATMNYLQRYCLIAAMHTPSIDGKGHGSALRQKKPKHLVMPKELLIQPTVRNRTFENFVNKGASDNILDITTLKQQPKLL